jgi:rRNA maturation RNase YbeY
MVELFEEDVQGPVLEPVFFEDWLSIIVSFHGRELGDVVIVLCSDDYLLKVNIDYLSHDYYTDIITFDYSDECTVSGDLFISWDRVLENSLSYGVTPLQELYRVCAHGVLHLVGFKDKTFDQAMIMRQKEDWALSLLNVSRETL